MECSAALNAWAVWVSVGIDEGPARCRALRRGLVRGKVAAGAVVLRRPWVAAVALPQWINWDPYAAALRDA